MKKYISFIFAAFIVFINFLAPFNFEVGEDKIINNNIAQAEEAECTIVSAIWDPSGKMPDNFFKDSGTAANIIIKTKNCTTAPGIVYLSVYEDDGVITNITNDVWNDSGLYERPIPVPSDNFTLTLQLGEEDCANTTGGELGSDCDLYFKIGPKNNLYNSQNRSGGELDYECDDTCDENAKLIDVIEQGSDDKPVNIDIQQPTVDNDYNLLAPIGSFKKAPNNIGDYFNLLFKLAIGLCGVLAVVMIIISGVQYMGDESIFGKTEAKSGIKAAFLGLFIALGSYALLNTIDPRLLGGGGLTIDGVSVEIEGDTDEPIGNITSLPPGIICGGGKINIPNIAKSFSGKMTYKMGAKGTVGPGNTIQFDCSGFANYVLKCAGVPFVNGGTASIFNGAEKVTKIEGAMVNGKVMSIGDLVGWRAGENKEKYGHVMVYIGSGQIQAVDSHGGSTVGNALGIFPISQYKNRITYIKRAL